MQFQPYSKYKSSGIDWLGEIPEGWEVKRLKDIKSSMENAFVDGPFGSNLKTEHFIKNGDVYVIDSGYITSGEFFFHRDYKTIAKEHYETIKRSECFENDIIIAKIGANFGMSAILPKLNKKSVVSGNSLKLTVNLKTNDLKFIHYSFLYLKSTNQIDILVKGSAQPALSMRLMSNLYFLTPNKQTQAAIADYLDKHTTLIDKKIETHKAKKQSYTELKQTLINEVVTKGLDTSVEMKDSGIEWIGHIPKHWEVKRLKEISNNIYAGGTPSTIIDEYWNKEDYIWLPSGELQNKIIYQHDDNKFVSKLGLQNSSTKLIEKNTVLIALTGATCANIGYLTFKACANQSVVAITNSQKFYSKFLFYFLLIKRSYIKVFQTGGAQAGINTEDVKNLWTGLPPKSEQIAIADYLDEKTSKIDQIIKKIDKNILALQEFRKTLINDVVTGKVKVL